MVRDSEKKQYRPLVYICSPYSGDIDGNTKDARRYSRFAVDEGAIPLTPHLMLPQFMDDQLEDAAEAISIAEQNLIAIGIPEADVKARSKKLVNQVPEKKMGLLFALIGADTYKKFVMKYRNYRNIVNAQNAAKPMLALDVSELDYDPELLNTPDATYDLTKGLDGSHPHNPDDLITKITACSPGDKGMKLWLENLDLFFCKDQELISYVQQIVGMAAVGRVYAEQMIIAYGGGANGKSTFWNTIARVLGNYSGKISAEALTMNCKRNVKPEMAELKGKRLIIASELEEGQRLNTGMVKQLCSIDPIEAEKKYKDPFHFDPSHTLVLYTNYLPKVSANDDGTWRRLIVIPFNAKISGKSDVKNYSDYLFEHAGPAIMKWIIEGAGIAIKKGFKIPEPKAVRDAVEDDKYVILPYFWVPEDTLDLRVRRDHVPYDLWEKQGTLETTEGNVIHYGYIEKFIERLGERFNIREIAFDRWGAVQMVQNLEGMGFTVVPFGQGFASMSPPTKELMRLTLDQKIAHGGHPVLRWMMDNVFIRTDPAGNIKADKEKSSEKIDGVIATVMALDRAIRCGNDNSESVYNSRGLLFI